MRRITNAALTENFLQGNVPLRHLLNVKPPIMSWWRSAFNEVNDSAPSLIEPGMRSSISHGGILPKKPKIGKLIRPLEYKTFLKVGQMSSDPRDVTPFVIGSMSSIFWEQFHEKNFTKYLFTYMIWYLIFHESFVRSKN